MPAPLSLDLRNRIVEAARTHPHRAVAKRFAVSVATVERLVARDRAGESLEPKPHGGGAERLVGKRGERLLTQWIEENPTLTQTTLAARFEKETGQTISRQTVGRTLARLGYIRNRIGYVRMRKT